MANGLVLTSVGASRGRRVTKRPGYGWLGVMAQRKRLWGFDDADRDLLIAATEELPELRAVVARAERRADLHGLWIVQAGVRELDEMYSLVEALMGGTRGRRRREQLEGLLATLCTSIDGF